MFAVLKIDALLCFCFILKGKYAICESITKTPDALHLDTDNNG